MRSKNRYAKIFRYSITYSFLWTLIHIGIAFIMTRLPQKFFKLSGFPFYQFTWEEDGVIYDRLFRVRKWKKILPDGAMFFSGAFRKAHIESRSPEYLSLFAKETCRGELVHWVVLLISPLFFLKGFLTGTIMIIYAAIANIPCIIVQRYNRPVLIRLSALKETRLKRSI